MRVGVCMFIKLIDRFISVSHARTISKWYGRGMGFIPIRAYNKTVFRNIYKKSSGSGFNNSNIFTLGKHVSTQK